MKKTLLTILFSAAILLAVSAGLADLGREKAEQEWHAMLRTLLPGSETFTEEAYTGEDVNIRAAYRGETGFVVHTAAPGYAGEIAMLVGVSNAGQVTGLVVRNLRETPGLGAKALTDTKFLSQFLNADGDAVIGEDIDALTGATVTSRAVARCVNSAVGYVTGADTVSGATA